jgi:7,8-dihydropterin-6-yl-methyl-4-(beta-D-ribofuranosyl)aminobenzene 5'-phosphate synthase
MRRFAVDPLKIKNIILSHDDWDHISGLWYLLPKRANISVHICPGFSREVKDRIASFGVRLVESDKPILVKDGIYTTGQLYGESNGRKIFEQSVAVKTGDGLAVICGCAHPGVNNIVKKASEDFRSKVDLLIGGFHLKDNTDEVNERIIGDLKNAGVRRVMPMHCTGRQPVEQMRLAFGPGFRWLKEGDVVEL